MQKQTQPTSNSPTSTTLKHSDGQAGVQSDSIGEELYHQPITVMVKNGVIQIPQPFLKQFPEYGQCDIEMVSDNVMVVVFRKKDNCFTKLKTIEHILQEHKDGLLDREEKATFLRKLHKELQELWKLASTKGNQFEQFVIMMKVAIRRIEPESFNLVHLNLFLDMINRLQQNQITKEDVQKYDKLLAEKEMNVMLQLGQEIAQSYLEER